MFSFSSALENLFACLGIRTEHACTTATSFMCMLVTVENTSAASPGGSGRYEVFFAPEDDLCGLSDDGDFSKLSEDDFPELVNPPTATTAVASSGNTYSSSPASTASSNTLIASPSPALIPSFPARANSTVAAVASTVAPSTPPAVALAGTPMVLPVSPGASVVAPVFASNTTAVLAAGVTASAAALYAVPFVPPPNTPLNAIPPPAHLVTPIYGYHVPAANATGLFYAVTRGCDVGIFAGW